MIAVLAGAGGLLLAAATCLAVLRRRFVVVSVSGASMMPALRHGERVLVRRVPGERLRRGDVVVLREPGPCRPARPAGTRRSPWVIKRVAAVPGDTEPSFLPTWDRRPGGVVAPGHVIVLGDNTDFSRDSRHFGAVPADRVLGVVLRRLGGGKPSSGPPPPR
ncbi:S26 family signal peptidase [Thermoactinospora rubra]|uniref:S26 family signal peptidase n=1 Tax=Thermoactinospora rubra TaxID=1088767 RepID=UPI000A103544|nr:S26 family signal peptidase [Thermoactinospora rubra]